ncbi:MAG: DUF2283 domain-containing protein [Chloroflexota bacterium]
MRRFKYSRDVDILMVELSDKKVDYADEVGPVIVHYTKEREPVLLEIQDARNFLLSSLSSIVKETEVALP